MIITHLYMLVNIFLLFLIYLMPIFIYILSETNSYFATIALAQAGSRPFDTVILSGKKASIAI